MCHPVRLPAPNLRLEDRVAWKQDFSEVAAKAKRFAVLKVFENGHLGAGHVPRQTKARWLVTVHALFPDVTPGRSDD